MTVSDTPVDDTWKEFTDLNQTLISFVKVTGTLQPDRVRPEDGLSLTQGFVLMELDLHPALSQRDLGERLALGKSTVSRLISELDFLGLVDRQKDPSNHRLHRVYLTPEGRSAAAQITGSYFRRHAKILNLITPEERQALRVGLTAFVRASNHLTKSFSCHCLLWR